MWKKLSIGLIITLVVSMVNADIAIVGGGNPATSSGGTGGGGGSADSNAVYDVTTIFPWLSVNSSGQYRTIRWNETKGNEQYLLNESQSSLNVNGSEFLRWNQTNTNATFFLNASNIFLGTIPDTRLSSSIALLQTLASYANNSLLSTYVNNSLLSSYANITLLTTYANTSALPNSHVHSADNITAGIFPFERLQDTIVAENLTNNFTSNQFFAADIGIGTPAPNGGGARKLHINATSAQVHLTSNNGGSTATDGSLITQHTDSNLYITNQEAASIFFYTNGGNRLSIASDGGIAMNGGKGDIYTDASIFAATGVMLDSEAGTPYVVARTGTTNDANSAFIVYDKSNNARLTVYANGNTAVSGTLTVNGNQAGAADHVFDDYNDIELLQKWRRGETLPFETGDMLNRDRLLRDAILQLETRVKLLEEKCVED